jgi:hypothetical protein
MPVKGEKAVDVAAITAWLGVAFPSCRFEHVRKQLPGRRVRIEVFSTLSIKLFGIVKPSGHMLKIAVHGVVGPLNCVVMVHQIKNVAFKFVSGCHLLALRK